MFSFQNRASEASKSKLHVKQCNRAYLEKQAFLTIAGLAILRPLLDSWRRKE